MLWQELTSPHFGEWVEKSRGVCLLPLGVLERHGDHLPIGTDMYTATHISRRAAEISPAVVFPYYFLGQISEARHYKGTIAASHRLMMDALLEMCDEISRNGFHKILIVNSHGGNNYFLPFFMQEMQRLDRKYSLYFCTATRLTGEQTAQVQQLTGVQDMGAHAGIKETALLMHLCPELVHMEDMNPERGKRLGRIQPVEEAGVYSSYGWYANYPYHFAGDPTGATPELGAKIFEMVCANVAAAVEAVKADTVTPGLIEEFARLGRNPQ